MPPAGRGRRAGLSSNASGDETCWLTCARRPAPRPSPCLFWVRPRSTPRRRPAPRTRTSPHWKPRRTPPTARPARAPCRGRPCRSPTTSTPPTQALVAAPYRVPAWNANPPDADGWARHRGQARRGDAARIGQGPRGAGRHHRADHDRRREGLHPHPEGDPRRPQGPGDLQHPWRRLRLRPRRVGNRRGHADGGLRRLQGHRGRLPHAARRALSGRHGRRRRGLQGGDRRDGPEESGRGGHLDGRRHDAGADVAAEGRGRGAARCHRARHALVRHDRDGRHLQDQRVGRQRAGELLGLPRPRGAASTPPATTSRTRSCRRSTATSAACRRPS